MTANETTVAVIRCDNHSHLFDSHCRDRYGRSSADGTAVLLRFSSAADVHRHLKCVHGVFTSSTRTCNFVVDHDRRCQFDVGGIRANLDIPQVLGVSQPTSHGSASVNVSSPVVTVGTLSSSVSGGVCSVKAVPVSVTSSSTVSTPVRSYASVVSSVSRGVSTVSTSSAVLGDISSCPPDVSDLSSFPPLSTSSVSDVCGVTSAASWYCVL